jgi:cation transport ATPase
MKKTYKCEVDCANCAAKMEDAIKKLEGVVDARVNFMTQKLTLEAADDVYDKVLKEAVKACKKVEPDCEIEI